MPRTADGESAAAANLAEVVPSVEAVQGDRRRSAGRPRADGRRRDGADATVPLVDIGWRLGASARIGGATSLRADGVREKSAVLAVARARGRARRRPLRRGRGDPHASEAAGPRHRSAAEPQQEAPQSPAKIAQRAQPSPGEDNSSAPRARARKPGQSQRRPGKSRTASAPRRTRSNARPAAQRRPGRPC